MNNDIIKNANSIDEFNFNENVFSVKILSSFLAYGNYPDIAKFWTSSDCDYCLWGDNLTISGNANKDFVEFLNPKTILCSAEIAQKLNLNIIQSGEILHKNLDGEKQNFEITYSDDINIIYDILKSCEMIDDYESFKLECSHKLRHALGAYEMIDKKAVAMALYSFENCAIISTVAVLKEYRRQGLGKKVLANLEQKLKGREVFLLKEKDKNENFYKKQNYKTIGHWVVAPSPSCQRS